MNPTLTPRLSPEAATILAAVFESRPVPATVRDWLTHQMATAPPVQTLSDAEVIALMNSMMPEADAELLADLHYDQQERQLSPAGRADLDRLMVVYTWGQLRKPDGLVEAVNRGLHPRGAYGRP